MTLVGRFFVGLFMACLGVLASVGASFGGAANYAGGYNGVGPAAGMVMILEQDQARIYGRIVDGQRNIFQINGRVDGNTVQGSLYNERAKATFQVELRPSGIKFIFIPEDANGRPNFSARKQYSFTRGRVNHPALADFRVPPPRPGDRVDIVSFIENYRSWRFADVVVAYRGVDDKARADLNIFDHVQADLLLRLCRGKADVDLIDAAGTDQPITCEALIEYADRAEQMGVFQDFYDVAEVQRASLTTLVACRRGIYPVSRCQKADKLASVAAMDWRNAKQIFIELTEKEMSLVEVLGLHDLDVPSSKPRTKPADQARNAAKDSEAKPISIVPGQAENVAVLHGLIAAAEIEHDSETLAGAAGVAAPRETAKHDPAKTPVSQTKPPQMAKANAQPSELTVPPARVPRPSMRPNMRSSTPTKDAEFVQLPRPRPVRSQSDPEAEVSAAQSSDQMGSQEADAGSPILHPAASMGLFRPSMSPDEGPSNVEASDS